MSNHEKRALIQHLAWDFPYAMGAVLKKKKTKRKKKIHLKLNGQQPKAILYATSKSNGYSTGNYI